MNQSQTIIVSVVFDQCTIWNILEKIEIFARFLISDMFIIV